MWPSTWLRARNGSQPTKAMWRGRGVRWLERLEERLAPAIDIIDFEGLPPAIAPVALPVASPYTEDGYRLDAATGQFLRYGTTAAFYPGSTALFNNTPANGSVSRLTRAAGGVFDLLGIKLAHVGLLPADPNGPQTTVTFVGTKVDRTTVTQTFALPNTVSQLTPFAFPSSFTNLVKVEWANTPRGHQFDDITVQAAAPNGTTSIFVDGADNLTVQDIAPGGQNDRLTLTRSGTNLLITDPGNVLTTTVGTQIDAHTVSVPYSAFPGAINVNTLQGNDRLTIDYAGGDPLVAAGLNYDGGAGGSDRLAVKGSGTQAARYTPSATTNGNGVVAVAGRNINFVNLEPVDITGMLTATVASPANAANALVVNGGFDSATGLVPALVVSGNTGLGGTLTETAHLFGNTTVVLDTSATIGAGANTITVATSPTAGHANTNLTFVTTAFGSVTVNAAVTVAGTITVTSPTITLNANLTAATITGSGLTVTVDDAPSGQIQDGVDVSATGAIITVNNGTYKENVTVYKSVTVQGQSRAGVVVAPTAEDANASNPFTGTFGANLQIAFLVTVDAVTIKRLTIDGRANLSLTPGKNNFRDAVITPIDGLDDDDLIFDDLDVKNTYYRGVQISASGNNNRVSNSSFTQSSGGLSTSGAAVVLLGGTSATTLATQVIGNTITSSSTDAGVWVFRTGAAPVVIRDNTLTSSGSVNAGGGSGTAIFVTDNASLFGATTTVNSATVNVFGNAITAYFHGVHVNSVGTAPLGETLAVTIGSTAPLDDNDLDGPGLPGSKGVWVEDASPVTNNTNVKIDGNLTSIRGAGIGIDIDGGDARITNNHVAANGTGVRVTNGGEVAALGGLNFRGELVKDNGIDLQLTATAGQVTFLDNIAFAGETFFLDVLSPQSINLAALANITFDVTGNFNIEQKVHHRVDTDVPVTAGLVTWVTNNVFVTNSGTSHSIQRGVDAAPVGYQVNAQTGANFVENVNVNKAVTLSVEDGTQTGVLTLQGNLSFSAAGARLRVDLNGPTAGTQYDQLAVFGTVNLAAGNPVSLQPVTGFVPALGSDFDILLSVPPVQNQFLQGSLVSGGGFSYSIQYNPGFNGVRLTLVAIVADVFVNEDWAGLADGSSGFSSQFPSAVIGSNAFARIADGLAAARPGSTVYVAGSGANGPVSGSYDTPFTLARALNFVNDTDYNESTATLSAAVTLAGPATFLLDNSAFGFTHVATTTGGPIGGPGSLTISMAFPGPGSVTLAAVNTYTGATTLNAGVLTILPGGALYSGSTGQVNLNAAGVTLNGGGQVFGQIDVFASTAAAQTTVQGLSIILPGVGNGIELRNASTDVLISDVTLAQGGGPTTNGVVIPTGTSARILASTIQGHNNGVRVAGGKALIQGTNLSNNTPGSNSAGLWVGGQGAVDAGQITTVAFLGFAGTGPLTSNGRNTFNGYTASDQGVINANADGPGPQGVGGSVSDVMAQCNVWNGFDTATVATPGNFNYTAIESVVTHDVDQAARGFVNYVKPASASPTLIAVRYYNETDAEPVGQRSMIRLFNFAFDNFVVGVNGGVTVTKVASVFDTRTGSTVYGNLTLVPKSTGFNPQTGQFRHEFSFSRAAGLTESSGSLVDGNYTFSINPSLIRALNNAGPGAAIGGTVPVSFHRLFGDVNGDAKVNAADQAVFNGALRSRRGMASYVSYLDFNLDSFIDTTDGTQFQRRFGLY